jgi:hypothetical protein
MKGSKRPKMFMSILSCKKRQNRPKHSMKTGTLLHVKTTDLCGYFQMVLKLIIIHG